MHAVILDHIEYEGAGYCEQWLQLHKAEISRVQLYNEHYILPDLAHVDLLIICGGPMSIHDEHEHRWLSAEKAYIRQAIDNGCAILGLCLGAQLIASQCGAEIRRNHKAEIGWFELTGLSPDADTYRFPDTFTVMEWHYDTFDLPAGAKRLASSPSCENQAFQIGRRIIGLQFHPEMTSAEIQYFIRDFSWELKAEPGIQSADVIERGITAYAGAANKLLADILVYLSE